MTTSNFYRHSGKAPILGLILLGAAGFISIPILGLLYGYLDFYIPIVYLTILLVFGYVFAIGFVLSKAATFGKVRNTFIIGLVGFFFGLFAEYVGWVAWIAALAKDPSYLIEFFFPLDILTIIVEVGKEGVWSFKGATPTGTFLYLIWLAEALFVVGGITYYAIKLSSDIPFCEDSDAWANKKSAMAVFAPLANPVEFKNSISQGVFSVFNELKPIQTGNAFTLFELYECDVCKNFFVLNIKDVQINRDQKGRQVRNEKPIVKNLIATPSTLSLIKRVAQEHEIAAAQPNQ